MSKTCGHISGFEMMFYFIIMYVANRLKLALSWALCILRAAVRLFQLHLEKQSLFVSIGGMFTSRMPTWHLLQVEWSFLVYSLINSVQ
ncbi:Uncharacterized protein TCM_001390 [Theobroma cacao]|uniref:Uncharacterized protein n=1 Tax=Theobroma cacao TaxID=3641 RepID=A0A061DR48_THECC|nr:Uncharacterized protein TCM_001390 [Theobroma cacao]